MVINYQLTITEAPSFSGKTSSRDLFSKGYVPAVGDGIARFVSRGMWEYACTFYYGEEYRPEVVICVLWTIAISKAIIVRIVAVLLIPEM